MNPGEYDKMFALEGRYWWFVGRRRLALSLLYKHASPASRDRLNMLDLGCGTGALLAETAPTIDGFGVDRSELALKRCRERGLTELALADGERLPLQDGAFDGVIALDIFEHIAADRQALCEAFRVLRPGGVLVLSVPAFSWLWGPHDVALHHHRRYRLPEVRERLCAAGFEMRQTSYAVFLLFPLVVLRRAFEKLRRGEARASLPRVPGWLNRILIWILQLEARWIVGGARLPWGSSVVAVAIKPVKDA